MKPWIMSETAPVFATVGPWAVPEDMIWISPTSPFTPLPKVVIYFRELSGSLEACTHANEHQAPPNGERPMLGRWHPMASLGQFVTLWMYRYDVVIQ